MIVGDLNHNIVLRVFTELTVVQGLHNHVDFPTHQRGGSLDPMLTDLAGDSVQSHPMDFVDTSDHLAVLSTINLAPACEEDHHRTIWLWDQADVGSSKTSPGGDFLGHNVHRRAATRRHHPHHHPSGLTAATRAAQDLHNEPKGPALRYKRWLTQRNKAMHRAACTDLTQVAKWAKARWEDNNRRMLSSNQLDSKWWWSLVKEKQGVTSHERVPVLTKLCGNLAITSQEKDLLLLSKSWHDALDADRRLLVIALCGIGD
ncbi:hypothetical protein E2C01_016050 [Portunus trituberculatus]|uniref:Endonuclease/exonuclease/phosphatase domain-containing protein n=1 Tax=Portunus trituberculatus TaxID=210409 RepID=A0A5B7DP75_PORTR|nr:hypothetical protein [Portunus trituberculatus]